MRRNVMAEPLFPGSSTTYEQAVRVFFESSVFPDGLELKGVGKLIKRDNVIVERVDRDGNSWWIACRARYSGKILGVGYAERARVEYDNGHINVDLGGLKGVLNTGGIANWLDDVLGKHPDSGMGDTGQQGKMITLQNTAVTKWQNWYLDIDGGNGQVILWDRLGSGGRWKLQDLGDGTVALQVTANVSWTYWYLDIDGNTGEVILWERLGSGGRWKLTELGDNVVTLQVTADVQWKDWYLDIDGDSGRVILWDRLGSGGRWKRMLLN